MNETTNSELEDNSIDYDDDSIEDSLIDNNDVIKISKYKKRLSDAKVLDETIANVINMNIDDSTYDNSEDINELMNSYNNIISIENDKTLNDMDETINQLKSWKEKKIDIDSYLSDNINNTTGYQSNSYINDITDSVPETNPDIYDDIIIDNTVFNIVNQLVNKISNKNKSNVNNHNRIQDIIKDNRAKRDDNSILSSQLFVNIDSFEIRLQEMRLNELENSIHDEFIMSSRQNDSDIDDAYKLNDLKKLEYKLRNYTNELDSLLLR